jgi:hypothetical protein
MTKLLVTDSKSVAPQCCRFRNLVKIVFICGRTLDMSSWRDLRMRTIRLYYQAVNRFEVCSSWMVPVRNLLTIVFPYGGTLGMSPWGGLRTFHIGLDDKVVNRFEVYSSWMLQVRNLSTPFSLRSGCCASLYNGSRLLGAILNCMCCQIPCIVVISTLT